MNICATKASLQLAGAEVVDPIGLEVNADRCVKRSAYLLSASGESAENLAKAAVINCKPTIRAAVLAGMDINGVPSNEQLGMISEIVDANAAEMREKALLWSIEGKAGKCHRMWTEN